MLKMGDRLIIPGKADTAAHAAARSAPAASPISAPPETEKPAPAAEEPPAATPTPHIWKATPPGEDVAEEKPIDRGSVPGFRWPVIGRVIVPFAAKNNGRQNVGINLAVPEGTAIRAAEDGVVTYAGSELKDYGNFVLVQHANGLTSAYAHAREIMVKRQDRVRRGQVIARSGQTGNVTSPQLHFAICKGNTPIDPMQYLPSRM